MSVPSSFPVDQYSICHQVKMEEYSAVSASCRLQVKKLVSVLIRFVHHTNAEHQFVLNTFRQMSDVLRASNSKRDIFPSLSLSNSSRSVCQPTSERSFKLSQLFANCSTVQFCTNEIHIYIYLHSFIHPPDSVLFCFEHKQFSNVFQSCSKCLLTMCWASCSCETGGNIWYSRVGPYRFRSVIPHFVRCQGGGETSPTSQTRKRELASL